MPTTLDNTKGGADANSYVDVSETAVFMDDVYGQHALWPELTADDKTRLLLTSAAMLEKLPLAYGKEDAGQAMSFPVADTQGLGDGFLDAKQAQFWQMLHLMKNGEALADAQNAACAGITQERAGSLTLTRAGFNPLKDYAPEALEVLAPFMDLSIKTMRG